MTATPFSTLLQSASQPKMRLTMSRYSSLTAPIRTSPPLSMILWLLDLSPTRPSSQSMTTVGMTSMKKRPSHFRPQILPTTSRIIASEHYLLLSLSLPDTDLIRSAFWTSPVSKTSRTNSRTSVLTPPNGHRHLPIPTNGGVTTLWTWSAL